MLTTTQAATYLRLAPPYLRDLICRGKGPATAARAHGGKTAARLFTIEELDRWRSSPERVCAVARRPAYMARPDAA